MECLGSANTGPQVAVSNQITAITKRTMQEGKRVASFIYIGRCQLERILAEIAKNRIATPTFPTLPICKLQFLRLETVLANDAEAWKNPAENPASRSNDLS